MKRLHREWRRKPNKRLSVLLEGIASPWNLGAVIRTAAAYRVDHLWIAASQITPETTNVGKVALGTDRYVTWTATETIEEAIKGIRSNGEKLVGLELADQATPMHETDLTMDLCLAVGHEDRGLSKNLIAACDAVVFLPQMGKIGSLNLATATSIGLYEIRRQGFTK